MDEEIRKSKLPFNITLLSYFDKILININIEIYQA